MRHIENTIATIPNSESAATTRKALGSTLFNTCGVVMAAVYKETFMSASVSGCFLDVDLES